LILVYLALPALVAYFFGFLGLGLLLVAKEHRRLFVALYLGAIVAAHVMSRWVPDVVALFVASLPVLFAIWDRGGRKAMLVAALVMAPLGYVHARSMAWAFDRMIWVEPCLMALPLVPFAVACWRAGLRRLSLVTLPAYLALTYLFFAYQLHR